MPILQEKILTYFEGKVVRKDLTSRVKGNAVVPAYVLEFLLGQYCAINDDEVIGWKIKLGRGLDIFEKPAFRFDISDVMQEQRQCRNCEITFIRQND